MLKINLLFILALTLITTGCNDYTSGNVENNRTEFESKITSENRSTPSIEVEKNQAAVSDSIMLDSTNNFLDDVYTEVVNDSIKEYQIAKKHGELVDICVQAGMVVAAQLQAKNENGYREWKKIEKTDCDDYENQEMSYFVE